MYKVITIIGTRPEIIRLSSIIKKLDLIFNHKLVHTNQNYDKNLNQVFFKDLNLKKPTIIFQHKAKTQIEVIASIFIKVEKLIKNERPDCVLVLGDTNSCLSVIVAKKYKIPVFHLEAGNRCYDKNTPEELNRKIIDHVSDYNLTYSYNAKQNLIQEGIQAKKIFCIGSPLAEVFNHNKSKIYKSNILKKLNLEKNKYLLVSFHREENLFIKNRFDKIITILKFLDKKFNFDIILSTHPKTKSKMKGHNNLFSKKVKLLKPFNFSDYMSLQLNAFYVISDSGSINEEASILGLDAINLRLSHERDEADDQGTTIMTMDYKVISNCINLKKNNQYFKKSAVSSYSDLNVSDKVIKLIMSYLNKN